MCKHTMWVERSLYRIKYRDNNEDSMPMHKEYITADDLDKLVEGMDGCTIIEIKLIDTVYLIECTKQIKEEIKSWEERTVKK